MHHILRHAPFSIRIHPLDRLDGRPNDFRRAVEIQDGERFHPGGIASDAKSLWVPVAEYRASSTSIIQRRSKHTLQLEFQFAVPDHIGCLAVTPDLLIGGNWDGRDFYYEVQLETHCCFSTPRRSHGSHRLARVEFDANHPSTDSGLHRSGRLVFRLNL